MDISGADPTFQQARFSLEQAKLLPLQQPLKGRENKEELMKAAKQFEGVFINMMLQEMDKTVERSDFLNGGNAEDTFRGLLYQNISDQIATRPAGSGFGMAEQIYKAMSRNLPEEQTKNNAALQAVLDRKVEGDAGGKTP